jgi:hypothetical protein
MACPLADRSRFTGQERLVYQEIGRIDEDRICRHAITLCDDHKVAADDLAPWNALTLSSSDHERPRACHGTQRIEHAFAPGLLNDGDRHRKRGKEEQDRAFQEVAQQQIYDGGTDQEGEHRLAQDLRDDVQRSASSCGGKFVSPFSDQSSSGFALVKTLKHVSSAGITNSAGIYANILPLPVDLHQGCDETVWFG